MILYLLDLAGVAVFAVSGALAAGRRSLDLLGVIVIALVTAIGGGTLRDLLLGREAVFWVKNPTYIVVIVAAALTTVVISRWTRLPERSLLVADALGLALFSVAGARIAETFGHGGLICVVMGTITGCAGGMIRDVLCAQIPVILRRGQIYATAAIAGISLYWLLQSAGLEKPWPSLAGMCAVAAMRLAALSWDLRLPVFSLPDVREEGER